MKKKTILRGLLGFPLGVFIGYTITIIISLMFANGYYSPVAPAFVGVCGSQIGAVVLQFVLCGVFGTAFAASSVVWENDKWSILKQTIIHFFVISLTTLPIAFFTHWMKHSLAGILSYFGIFIAMYVIIWLIQYNTLKYKIKQLNNKIKEANR